MNCRYLPFIRKKYRIWLLFVHEAKLIVYNSINMRNYRSTVFLTEGHQQPVNRILQIRRDKVTQYMCTYYIIIINVPYVSRVLKYESILDVFLNLNKKVQQHTQFKRMKNVM